MNDREHQIKQIVLTAVDECTTCGYTYGYDNIDVVGHRGDLWVLTVSCQGCEKQGFVAALMIDESQGAREPAHELREGETRAGEPVSTRDVHEMRAFLASFTGDLAAHLRRQS